MDWNKFNKVYTIDIGGIEITKEVSRIDIITTLMNRGELAFKSKSGTFVCDVTNKELRKMLIKQVEEESEELEKKEVQKGEGVGR